MTKVSVIVPVYNSEKNVARTIDSLLAQTLDDIEIILVNDGSSDNSLNIIKKYEQKYPKKIKVINQKNSGPGGARNSGIKAATGEYIGFLDSDDTQDKNMYYEMYEKAIYGNFDMVVCDALIIYPNKTKVVASGIDCDTFVKDEIKKVLIFSYAVLWNKLIKRDIVTKVNFTNNIWYEDIEYLHKLFPLINSIGTINKNFCNYYQNETSITYTYNERIYDIVKVMNNIISDYKNMKIYDEYINEIEYSYVRYLYGTFVKRLAKTKNFKVYKEGVNLVIGEVKKNFPHYKNNKYLQNISGKNLYLKYFNKFISLIIYLFEKNKLN